VQTLEQEGAAIVAFAYVGNPVGSKVSAVGTRMFLAVVAGVVLGAWYMLWAVERVFFGGSREPPRQEATTHDHGDAAHGDSHHDTHGSHGDRCDLQWYEIAALAPLAVFVLWIGLAPAAFLAPPAALLRANTRGAATAFAEQMRALEDLPPSTQPARIADRVVRRDQPAAQQPFTLTSELTLDRP
jgi:NADH:ubiquinone oxidoreductase subunit 5 (subunit L)/multisubunit Na+/H+ antiporter MnhA subunit